MTAINTYLQDEIKSFIRAELRSRPSVTVGWVVQAPNPDMELEERQLLVHILGEGNVPIDLKSTTAELSPNEKVAVAYNGRKWILMGKVHPGTELGILENIGNEFYFIDATGNAFFESISANTELKVAGLTLDDYLDTRSRGIQAWGSINHDIGGLGETETAVLEVAANFVDGRMYRVYTSTLVFSPDGTPTTSDPMRLNIRIRESDSGSPTTSSNQLVRSGPGPIVTAQARAWSCDLQNVISCDSAQAASPQNLLPGTHRFLLTCDKVDGTGGTTYSLDTAAGAVNPIQLIVEDIGPLTADIGVEHSGSGGGTTEVNTYTKTYTATDNKAYRGDGSLHSNTELAQGNGSQSPNGNMSSIIGFNSTTIQNDLSGATVTKCEVYLYYDHWHYIAGGTAVIGTHDIGNVGGENTRPTANMNENRKRVSNWGRNEGKWVSVGTTIGNEFKSGATKGICIGRGRTSGGSLSNSDEYYGKARGHSENNPPKVRITYEK
ncbi:hypothetical protein [Neptunomonas sp.]|uniref:hypothetical protein n=1 Tax=Neptunomonas sp. TaxID=1971898 RepID=UPI003564EA21